MQTFFVDIAENQSRTAFFNEGMRIFLSDSGRGTCNQYYSAGRLADSSNQSSRQRMGSYGPSHYVCCRSHFERDLLRMDMIAVRQKRRIGRALGVPTRCRPPSRIYNEAARSLEARCPLVEDTATCFLPATYRRERLINCLVRQTRGPMGVKHWTGLSDSPFDCRADAARTAGSL